eukprot:3373901-Pyramimonas_sp.AAC.1
MKAGELRCTAFKALKDFEQTANDDTTLRYGLTPKVVVAAQKTEKGKLVLAPLNKIRAEPSQGAAQVTRGPAVPHATPPTRATDQQKAEAAEVLNIPYWCCLLYTSPSPRDRSLS